MLSTCPFALFAQAPRPAGSPWERPELLYASLAIAGALLAGGMVLWLTDRWRKRGAARDGDADAAELTGFRGMLARGEITEVEYNRLRNKVAARLKPGAATAPAAPQQTAPAPPAAPPPPIGGPLPQSYFDDPPPPAPPAPPP